MMHYISKGAVGKPAVPFCFDRKLRLPVPPLQACGRVGIHMKIHIL